MANINKIRLSGQTYNIEDANASKTVELTQAQYDALTVKDPNTFYIITDSQGADLSNYYTKSETSGATEISTALNAKQDTLVSGTNIKTINNENILGSGNINIQGGGSSYTAGDGIDITNDVISVTGKVDTSAFTAHTADTVIHVTSAEKSAWNAKSDFSGSYNDLTDKPTIPTVPTSNTAFTNDAGYITSSALDGYATTGDVQTATNDMATKTWVSQQGYLTQHQSLSNYYTKSETSGATQISTALASKADTATTYTKTEVDNAITAATSTKQDTLVSGTNIKTINNESILGSGNITIEGGGKAVAAGTNISVTTGETADTINCTLPITADTNTNAPKIKIGSDYSLLTSNSSVNPYNITKAHSNILFGNGNTVFNNDGNGGEISYNFLLGLQNSVQAVGFYKPSASGNMLCGSRNTTQSSNDFAFGNYNTFSKGHQFAVGDYHTPKNDYETNFGKCSISVSASTAFGNSGNTLFSIANGYNTANTHNAIEIRQNGDIYIADTNDTSTTNYYQKPMIKLQDALGGTVDTEITSASTNPVTSAAIYNQFGGLKLVKLTQSEYDALTTKDNSTLYVIVN